MYIHTLTYIYFAINTLNIFTQLNIQYKQSSDTADCVELK